jgi:hypothetical protein
LLKQRLEFLVLAVEAGHIGGEASFVVKTLPADPMACLSGELAEERAQTARVALLNGWTAYISAW